MPEFTSVSSSSSGLASRASTMRARRFAPSRTMRPYAPGSGASNESTVAVAPSRRWVTTSSSSRSLVSAGTSPFSTSTAPVKPASAARAARTASPVPSGCSCTATSTPVKLPRASAEVTTTTGSAPAARAAAITQSTRRRPSSGWRCFGTAERMRVPSPAAMTTAAIGDWVTSGWLGRQDSNLGSRDQNPLPYHLATPHCGEYRAGSAAFALGEQEDQRGDREQHDDRDRDALQDRQHERHQQHEELHGREHPRRLAHEVRRAAAARVEPHHDRNHREHHRLPQAQHVEDVQEALDRRGPERELQPALAQPPGRAARAMLDRV